MPAVVRCLVFMKPYCLDIDTDYLVIPRVSSGGTDEHPALPWCWPEELVAKLGAADSFLAKAAKADTYFEVPNMDSHAYQYQLTLGP